MRIAAISDIHGNLGALDAVLDDIRRSSVDVIVNLGDILSGPLQPAETADRLMPLNLPTIKGNHERQLLGGDRTSMGLSDQAAFALLGVDHMRWIDSLPTMLRVDQDVLLVHGTPESDVAYFLHTVESGGARIATHAEVCRRAGESGAALLLCGHTHVPAAMQLDDGRLIVNPGSVGLQAYDDDHPYPHCMQAGSPHARYAILTREPTGWRVEMRAIEYDWNTAAALARDNGRPDWASALLTGRVAN